ncbi:hypothetical protein CR513_03746, partial [Mucuna pruriens]
MKQMFLENFFPASRKFVESGNILERHCMSIRGLDRICVLSPGPLFRRQVENMRSTCATRRGNVHHPINGESVAFNGKSLLSASEH